jgi:hypothetical protein
MSSHSERKIVRDIKSHGWHVIQVMKTDTQPEFGYSIGFHRTFQHPEILVMGLPLSRTHEVIDTIGDELRAGETFEAGTSSSAILRSYDCAFRTIPRHQYGDYLGYAMWFYGETEFPALQCVWPDPERRFPWDPGVEQEFGAIQPVLANLVASDD